MPPCPASKRPQEQAFLAAAPEPPARSGTVKQLASAIVLAGGAPASLALPPPPGGQPLVLPVMLLPAAGGTEPFSAGLKGLSFLGARGSSSGGLPAALLDVGAPSPGGLPTGERGAAPISSGGGGGDSRLSGGPWSIPAAHGAALDGVAPPLGGQLWTPAAAAAAGVATAAQPRSEGSFDAVLAALQAEADAQQQQLALGAGPGAGSHPAGRSMRMRGSPGARRRQAAGRSSGGGGSSRSSSRQGSAAAAAQRQGAQPLPTFDRTDAERQLRDKLSQVTAAGCSAIVLLRLQPFFAACQLCRHTMRCESIL